MKSKSIIFLLSALLFNCVVGSFVASALGYNPLAGMLIVNGGGIVLHYANMPATNLYAGLAKEIWLPDIIEQFIPDTSFLSEARSMDQFVDNDKINLAEAGLEPNVLVNNITYPVPFAERSDNPLEIVLDYFDTEGTVLRNAELAELSYDKRTSIINQHQNALRKKFARKAIHAWAPTSNDTLTPVLQTSGAAMNGLKSITFADILDLATKYDMMETEGTRVLVLHPIHFRQLIKEDILLMKDIIGNGKELFTFKIYRYARTPVFNKATGVKAAFGAAAAPLTDTISSVAFLGSEVMRALGTFTMFERLNDPEQKGDIINFQMRGVALPVRNKYISAIYSPASA